MRITEGMTRCYCGERFAYGMSGDPDPIDVDGRSPGSLAAANA